VICVEKEQIEQALNNLPCSCCCVAHKGIVHDRGQITIARASSGIYKKVEEKSN